MGVNVSDESPTIITRLVDERGCSMVGGSDTLGSAKVCVSRSCTICRARMGSVPGSKTSKIDDRPATDSE